MRPVERSRGPGAVHGHGHGIWPSWRTARLKRGWQSSRLPRLPAGRVYRSLRAMRARILALLSAVLVAVLWASPRGVEYLCSMDNQRRATCCCTPDGEHADRDHGRIERADCCEVKRDATVSPAVSPSGHDEAVQLASVSQALGAHCDPLAPSADVVPASARGPPHAVGPPPYLRNCRLLI